MCHHPILIGVLVGALALKIVARLVFRRRFGHGGCGPRGGGCGPGRFRRFHRRDGEFATMFHGGGFPDVGGEGGGIVMRKLAEVLGALELNARQKDEADEALAPARARFGDGSAELAAALAAAAADPFDAARAELLAEGAPDARAIVDGLEHLHYILTPEQREQLKKKVTV